MPRPESRSIKLIALQALPIVQAGDNLAVFIHDSLVYSGLVLAQGDVIVVAQKVVSKAEGRCVSLRNVVPSIRATQLATECGKDPRLVEVILGESTDVLRCVKDTLIVRHRLGFVSANAAVDASNVGTDDPDAVLLLPVDPDGSAERLRASLEIRTGVGPGVIINDSFGRAWRLGTIGTAIGAAGVPSLEDLRGCRDLFGRPLMSTEVGTADQLASAASLLQGQAAEGFPVVLIRGFSSRSPDRPAGDLLRPQAKDLFS